MSRQGGVTVAAHRGNDGIHKNGVRGGQHKKGVRGWGL